MYIKFTGGGYSDRGQYGNRQGSIWDMRGNRGNYSQFNDETGGGSRDWSRNALSRSYGNRPPSRGTGLERKPYPEEMYNKDLPPGLFTRINFILKSVFLK